MSLDRYTIIGPLAYRGKPDCDDVRCTHRFVEGVMQPGCIGWHCSYCDQPCSSQGHRCDAADAILGEASRVAREQQEPQA